MLDFSSLHSVTLRRLHAFKLAPVSSGCSLLCLCILGASRAVAGCTDLVQTDLYKYSYRCRTSYSRRIISCSHG